MFRVTRCRYSVGATERRLAEIAAKYGTNWLQIWKMNPELSHPDYVLHTGQSVAIGRLLSVGAGDDLQSIALRYGTTVETLYDLNYDLNRTATIRCTSPFEP
jgi:LysM repeat protein